MLIVATLAWAGASGGAAGPARSAAWEVATPRVRVLYPSPDLEAYARRVAATADAVWLALAERFAVTPRPLILTLDDDTDAFNAIATVEPRRGAALRAVFPVAAEVGRDAADPLRLLLVHELAHVLQLDFDRLSARDGDAGRLRLGLVGEGIAAGVPMWFLEGFATWLESDAGPGGRLASPRTLGLVRALALEPDAWPSLDALARTGFDAWPGGEARYLLGAQMVEAMVARHGEDALRRLLAELARSAPFASFPAAWRAAGGDDLDALWAEGFAREARAAARIADAWAPHDRAAGDAAPSGWHGSGERVAGGGRTAHPALAPGGDRLAWAAGDGTIRVASVTPDGVGDARVLARDRSVTGLAWADAATLIATAYLPVGGGARAEMLAIDAATGAVTWQSEGAQAWAARADPWRAGCLLFVRDRGPRGNALARACPGIAGGAAIATVWTPPAGLRLVDLATHPTRGAALAVWGGGETRLAHLPEPSAELRWLTGAAADVRHPVWTADGGLRLATDALGVWEVVELELDASGPAAVRALTRSVGGTDQPTAGRFARRLEADGYALIALPRRAAPGAQVDDALALDAQDGRPAAPTGASAGVDAAVARLLREPGPPPPERAAAGVPGAARGLAAGDELALYGWLPTTATWTGAGPAAEVTAFGQDVLGRRGLRLVAGLDPSRRGPLGPWWAYAEADTDPVASVRTPLPWSVAVRLGAWPYAAHRDPELSIAVGARVELRTRRPVRLADRAAVAFGHLAVDAVGLAGREAPAFGVRAFAGVSTRRGDAWGAPTRGAQVALHAAWQPLAGAPRSDAAPTASGGLWIEAEAHAPLGAIGAVAFGGTTALHAGWRPAAPVPLALEGAAAVASVTGRLRAPLRLRALDGLVAVEALRLEPSLRGWVGGASAATPEGDVVAGVGADLGVLADVAVGYGAPLRVGLRGGWSDRWWIGTELALPVF